MTWTKHPHPWGTTWRGSDNKGFILRVGGRYVLYEVGVKGRQGHYPSLDEAQQAHEAP
jgi:hypothetical protein